MTGRVKVGVAIACGVAFVASVGGALWMKRPFQAELGSYRTSLADRTEAQRHNIRQAVMALDGVIIEPGATFSFNDTVGPRTPERGYSEAPAFMEQDLVTSIGGGICQVSSTIYNAVALAGLTIVERHPHFRRVSSVPPGRDATVWYGVADLRVKNSLLRPVRLLVGMLHDSLYVSVQGATDSTVSVKLLIEPQRLGKAGQQSFRVLRVFEGHPRAPIFEVLSVDTYNAK